MASAANDDVVVANLDSGDVMAFYVVDLNEPDIPHIPVIFDAYERSVPQEALDVTAKVHDVINQLKQSSAAPQLDKVQAGIPTHTLYLPSTIDINGSQFDISSVDKILGMSNIANMSAVSNFIKLALLPSVMEQISATIHQRWKFLFSNISLTIQTNFADGSKAQWVLINPWESLAPYRYIIGSAKNSNNENINEGFDGVSDVSSNAYDLYQGYGNISSSMFFRLECFKYQIEYSFGQRGRSQICFKKY